MLTPMLYNSMTHGLHIMEMAAKRKGIQTCEKNWALNYKTRMAMYTGGNNGTFGIL